MRPSDMKNKQRIKIISTILLITAFVFSITMGVIDRSTALPENPMSDELMKSTKGMLSSKWKELVEEEKQEEETEKDKEEEEQEDEVEEDQEKNEEDKEDEQDQEENKEDEQDTDVNETEKEQDDNEETG